MRLLYDTYAIIPAVRSGADLVRIQYISHVKKWLAWGSVKNGRGCVDGQNRMWKI